MTSEKTRRVAHDLALAALIGGNLFGRTAMHPALADISDPAERGKVLNHAWRRYGTVNSLALLTLTGTWLGTRRPGKARGMTRANDLAIAAVVVTGLASAAGGVGFAQQAPAGSVPMSSGQTTSPDATRQATRIKQVLNVLGALNLAADVALLALNYSR